MPETEADRIIREKLRREQELQEEGQRRRAAHAKSLIPKIEGEIPVVLRLLRAHGYPDMVTVNIKKEFSLIDDFFDSFRRRSDSSKTKKAAWKIGEYAKGFAGYGDSGYLSIDIYLLSDGRIYLGPSEVYAPRSLPSNARNSCLEGLRDLRRKLEAM